MTRSRADVPNTTRQSRTLLLATDNKNSVLAEVAGGKLNSVAYSAYGEQSAQDDLATGLGFNGALREQRLGWYLLGNGYRAYNPTLMRFHSPDSWSPFGGGGLNTYMYCVGDPVNFSDPTGHVRLFPGISKSITRPARKVFDFFGGGSSVTGPKKSSSSADKALKQLGGLAGAESDELSVGMFQAGSAIGAAPYPYRAPPRISSFNEGIQSHAGYEAGAAAAGLTTHGSRPTPRTSQNPNLLVGRSRPSGGRHQFGRDGVTITDSSGRTTTYPREPVRGGGDATGTHPRSRMNDIQTRDRAFVEQRNETRREALIAAMEIRNTQLRRAGLPQREIMIAVRREAPGMLRQINGWLQ